MKSKKLDFLIKHIDRKNHLGNFLKCLILYQIRYLTVKNIQLYTRKIKSYGIEIPSPAPRN